ncbi:GntR family transcriptional regulator [Krasilnikovia cinnamomea]|uniref:GntR family transcriptional regulator n=1 Tax=Krasilnikovia cinnamomea TaxID=349313 RepID=A0A4Q7ZQF5_9ACTN|nr:FCD domain-containing protein [Krasilnikovia cinnamomea]RZU52685.1 GntR family transcriptional regulator [Krasilnikovia cinnamomea]
MVDNPEDASSDTGPESQLKSAPEQALDAIGLLIVEQKPGFRDGDVISAEAVARRTGVSKATGRDVIQALSQMRLVQITPRVGATVQKPEEWNMLDPSVIDWRLQLRSSRLVRRALAELRDVLEPAAARFAAQRATADVCQELYWLAEDLFEIGHRKPFTEADRKQFRDVDGRFHTALLAASGNEAFRSLAHVVVGVMNYRIDRQWAGDQHRARPAQLPSGDVPDFPNSPEPIALWLHRCLARAVVHGQPEAAYAFSRGQLAEIDDGLLLDAELRAAIVAGFDSIELTAAERQEARDVFDTCLQEARERQRRRTGWDQ